MNKLPNPKYSEDDPVPEWVLDLSQIVSKLETKMNIVAFISAGTFIAVLGAVLDIVIGRGVIHS